MIQKLLYVEEWVSNPPMPNRAKPIALKDKPKRIWTLFGEKSPELPFVPVHNVNAFLEDFVHDWNWAGGKLRYYSRVTDRPVWILLEY